LAIIEGAEKEDANKLRQWCEVCGLWDDIEKFPKDGKPSDLGGLFDELGDLLYDMGDEIGAEGPDARLHTPLVTQLWRVH